MLLAAVAQELVPPLTAADHVNDIAAILVGFSLGVSLMIGLEFIISEGEESEGGQEMKENIMPTENETGGANIQFQRTESVTSGRSSLSKQSKARASIRINEKNNKASAKVIIPPFPIAFAAAVYIDSAMDGALSAPRHLRAHHNDLSRTGLLIGLALVTGKRQVIAVNHFPLCRPSAASHAFTCGHPSLRPPLLARSLSNTERKLAALCTTAVRPAGELTLRETLALALTLSPSLPPSLLGARTQRGALHGRRPLRRDGLPRPHLLHRRHVAGTITTE